MTTSPILDSPLDPVADGLWDAGDECPNCSSALPGGLVMQDLLGTLPLACLECGAVLAG
jgi:hypothetical protein